MENRRYVVIAEAPLEICSRIDSLRTELASKFGSYAALAYPPHITLRTGLIVPNGEKQKVFDAFSRLTARFGPIAVQTDGLTFGEYAPDKYLVAYKIKPNGRLKALHETLLQYVHYRKSDRTDFHPHMTLLFDDISKERYERASTFLNSGEADIPPLAWEIKEYGLYYLAGEKWKPEALFSL